MSTKIEKKQEQFKGLCKSYGLDEVQTEYLLKKAEEMYFQGQTDMNLGVPQAEKFNIVDFANNLLKSQCNE